MAMDKNKNINGMVEQMNRINVTVSSFKVVTIASLVVAAVTAFACVYLYTAQVAGLRGQIYVLDNGAAFTARAQSEQVTRQDEVTDHVRMFHELMFNVPPNVEMIQRNLERAFEMSDRSAYNYYNDLQETGFYKRMTGTNSYQQVEVQDIDIDMSVYPYQVLVHAYQYVNRESNISQFTLVTRCRVANAVRTAKNLHGLMIENFEVIENKLVETRNK